VNRPVAANARIIIVGGGIAGVATAWGLMQRGATKVLLLEREDQLGAHSTSKNASILRTFTGEPASTALALETLAFLVTPPPGFCAVPLIDPVGLVLVPRTFDPKAFAAWRARKAAGSVVLLEEAQLRELAPHYAGEARGAVLVRDEGHLDVAALFEAMLRAARRGGVEVRTGVQVTGFVEESGRLCGVELAGEAPLPADRVVIAAGGWAEGLARRAGSTQRFEPRRRHLLVTAAEPRVDRRWPIVWSEPDQFYVRPESGGLMLCACDQDVVDPDRCEALPEVRERIAARGAACLRGFEDARAAHFWAGMRTFTPDPAFAIGDDPDVPGLFWVAGLGGHGMTTSVGVGRLAAGLLFRETVDAPVARAVAPSRFSAVT
jgi:glycine/D-amino acid oxidase-like deaminating enzyme